MAGAPRSPRKIATPKPATDWRDPYQDDEGADPRRDGRFAPRLTLPSMPISPPARPDTSRAGDSGRHRTLADATSRQQAVRQPSAPNYPAPNESSGSRRRENSTARPLNRILAPDSAPPRREYAQDYARDEVSWDRQDRSLVPVMPYNHDLVPDLAVYKPRGAARLRVDTRALARRATSSPWSLTRLVLAIAAVTASVLTALIASGEPAEPLMGAFGTTTGSHAAIAVASMVQPETQIERPDLYDSYTQFLNWKGAACSAAALSEVLNAWGVPNINIGKVIDTMNSGSQPNISPFAGLLRTEGFQYAAGKYDFRGDMYRPTEHNSLTYNQILYLTNVLGIPVIINVRIAYGYYRFFDGGHFLVITSGDAQGVNIVDSSTYYIHYLQKDVLNQMFTNISVVITPSAFHYTLPNV